MPTRITQIVRFFCKSTAETTNFNTIYKYPRITLISLIGKGKLYYTALSAVSIPGATVLNQIGTIDSEALQAIVTVNLVGLVPLYIVGQFTRNFIGILYANDDGSKVKVAYLDFWGRRKDIVTKSDSLRFDEPKYKYSDLLYMKLRNTLSGDVYKFHIRDGVIDAKTINNTLGAGIPLSR